MQDDENNQGQIVEVKNGENAGDDANDQDMADVSNMREVQVEGIFIKHDFDHIIMDENEVEKYTNDDLTFSTMKQTMEVPF